MPVRKKKCIIKKKMKTYMRKPKLPLKAQTKHKTDNSKIDANIFNCEADEISSAFTKKYDKSSVPRIFSPFNDTANEVPRINERRKKMAYQSIYKSTGLSAKEKSYIICSCQTHSTRYLKLKTLAMNAIKQNKIFSIYGSCNAVRKALLERGWVEKVPPNRMNLSKIRNGTFANKSEIRGELERLLLSNLVEKHNPNFVWRSKDENSDSSTTIDMKKEYYTIVNKLKIDAIWTSKQGLCSSMKINYWFYIEDVAEVNGPRTYNTYNTGEIEGFVKDYKITACTSLLKWVLSMVAIKKPVFVESGQISINVVVFALNRCKEYLFRKQNEDIDRPICNPSTRQWNAFLKKYYRIIAKQDVFQADTQNRLPLYLSYAKILLKEMRRYRPQLCCEGCHDIWIIKPAHCSRGRGIRMASKLGVITDVLNKANAKYVIQKYVEEPLLIYGTKFDIRQYYLVTSTYPLVIWMYAECYLKFSSQKYSLKNYHESIHLTNNAVQRKYKNCTPRHSELPLNNMWDLETYRNYLDRIGQGKVWDEIIYPGMKKSIVSIMLSCQDSLSVSKNRFELYGCDFILDKEFKPWLIEINSCPDLNHTTPVTAKICPAVVSDIIKVVIDYAENPKSSTGKFECIYRQPMTLPKYGAAAEIFTRGYSLPLDYFHRGDVNEKECYEDSAISKVRDIKAILNKLKRHYDIDVMPSPGARNLNEKMKLETLNGKGELFYELLDKISSEDSCSETGQERDSIPKSSLDEVSIQLKRRTQSVTDTNPLLFKSLICFSSIETLKAKKSFSFSKLDDGPWGKASYFEICSVNMDN